MKNYGLGVKTYQGAGVNTLPSSAAAFTYGRVVDIILDSSHEKYEEKGRTLSLNGVFFVPLARYTTEEITPAVEFAYRGKGTLLPVPLKNEIVKVEYLPSPEGRDENFVNKRAYWTAIIPLWNHPHHNAYPDLLQFPEQETDVDLGKEFKESTKINPLQSFPGDTVLEGRGGQSLRFSNTESEKSPWIDSSNNGSPLIVLRNGQFPIGEGDSPVLEDINKDLSSMYFTSDHKVELQQANTKEEAWRKPPIRSDLYKGSQVLLNSNRLFFNAREEHILLSAKKGIGLNAESVSIDGESYIGLDAKKIYLGVKALKREQEPVLLGQTSIEWMDDFLRLFEQLVTVLSTPSAPPTYVATAVAGANVVRPVIPMLRQRLQLLLSKKVYTE